MGQNKKVISRGGIKMTTEKRFERIYKQGGASQMEIWIDKETGVNYLYHCTGYTGGLTPLLDRDGKPVVSPKLNG